MTPSQAATYHRQYLRWHTAQERVARRVVLQAMGTMAARLIATLYESGVSLVDANIELVVTEQLHQAALQAIYVNTGTDAARREYDRLVPRKSAQTDVLTKDRDNPLVTPPPQPTPPIRISFFSEQWRQKMVAMSRSTETAQRVTKITQQTRQLIRDVLADGAGKQLPIRSIAKNLRQALIDPIRALLIARTETTRAANAGHEMGAMSTNLLLNKIWVATADFRTRPSHIAAGQLKPVPRDGVFIVDGLPMKYPGDPAGGAGNVANCRCVVSYVPAKDYLNLN